jgi:hypothetical protein
LSGEISTLRYGPEMVKPTARERAAVHWARVRDYLRRVRPARE